MEHEFISVIVKSGDLTQALDAKVVPDWFNDPNHAKVWELILRHNRKYGEVPAYSVIALDYPNYRLLNVDHKVDWYVDAMTNSHIQYQLSEAIAGAQDALSDRNPRMALTDLLSALGHIAPSLNRMSDINLNGTWEDRIDVYLDNKRNKGRLRGLSCGFPSIDQSTMGFQPGQFIVLAGLPKVGKSTTLLTMCTAVHTAHQRPLFVGFEMSNEEQATRYDAIVAHVNYRDLLLGNMSQDQERALTRAGVARAKLPPFMLSADIASTTTVSGIGAKIDQYRPIVAFVDGVYLMDDELGEPKGSPSALKNISQGLKRLAQQKQVTLVATTQVNANKVSKSAGTMANSLYGTQAFGQDGDVLIVVEATDDPEVMKIRIVHSRNGPKVEVLILWDWSTGTFEELDLEDVL